MKRILFVFLLILAFSIKLFSYDLNGIYNTIDPSIQIELNNNGYGKQIEYGGKILQEFTYKHKTIKHLEYISDITKPILKNPFLKIDNNNEIFEFLILPAKIKYKGKIQDFIFGYVDDEIFLYSVPNMTMEGHCSYKDCTSFLKEGNKEYTTENLSEIVIGSPWVEGVNGNGEGEGFTIDGNAPYLLIINGFVSSKKPYLYEQNSRIKELEIIGSKSGKSKIVSFLDTPNPQTVDISFLDKEDDTIIRIESVYQGTKYQDTCITICRLFWWEVIPYMNEE